MMTIVAKFTLHRRFSIFTDTIWITAIEKMKDGECVADVLEAKKNELIIEYPYHEPHLEDVKVFD